MKNKEFGKLEFKNRKRNKIPRMKKVPTVGISFTKDINHINTMQPDMVGMQIIRA